MHNTEKKVKDFIEKHSMLKKDDKIIIALSGGADSVSLLYILISLGYDCIAAHCNFHLRAEESMRDEYFVTGLCKNLNVKLHKTDFDTEAYSCHKRISIEMAARELRYQFFHDLKKKAAATAIAVGHHSDDNIETILLNLTRGTGIQGLCGIQPVNGDIVRPLLCLDRNEIYTYLHDKGQTYVTDSTNLQDVYSRNKIRLDVLPLLEEINPGARNNILTTISNLNEIRKISQKVIQSDIAKCISERDCHTFINITALLDCTSPITILHEIISSLGFNSSQETQILDAVKRKNTGRLFHSGKYDLNIDREEIVISSSGNDTETDMLLSDFPDITQTITDKSDQTIDKCGSFAYIDAHKVVGQLHIRNVRQGDFFHPYGMKGRKLLSDYMTDRKFSRIRKKNQMVVYDDSGEIAWLVGERCSEKYKVDAKTTSIIVLHIIQ